MGMTPNPKAQQAPAGTAYCHDCDTYKPIAEFGKNNDHSNGISYYCKPCLRIRWGRSNEKRTEKILTYRLELKKQLVAQMGGKCHRCGYNEFIASLEFHHLDPTQKEDTLGSLLNDARYGGEQQLKRLQEEAAKCVLVCTNCHRGIHSPH